MPVRMPEDAAFDDTSRWTAHIIIWLPDSQRWRFQEWIRPRITGRKGISQQLSQTAPQKAAIPAFSESPTSHPKAMETKLRRIGRDTAKSQRTWVKGQRVRTTDRQRRVGGADRSNRASRCGLLSTAHESILSRFSPLTST